MLPCHTQSYDVDAVVWKAWARQLDTMQNSLQFPMDNACVLCQNQNWVGKADSKSSLCDQSAKAVKTTRSKLKHQITPHVMWNCIGNAGLWDEMYIEVYGVWDEVQDWCLCEDEYKCAAPWHDAFCTDSPSAPQLQEISEVRRVGMEWGELSEVTWVRSVDWFEWREMSCVSWVVWHEWNEMSWVRWFVWDELNELSCGRWAGWDELCEMSWVRWIEMRWVEWDELSKMSWRS